MDDVPVILSGFSHAGIRSIVDRAQRLTGEGRIRDVIVGFHLRGLSDDRLASTVSFFAALAPGATRPCHCTDFTTRCDLARPFQSAGSG